MATIWEYLRHAASGTQHWFLRLDRQEWLVVLIVGTCFGFLCMRGLGSKLK